MKSEIHSMAYNTNYNVRNGIVQINQIEKGTKNGSTVYLTKEQVEEIYQLIKKKDSK